MSVLFARESVSYAAAVTVEALEGRQLLAAVTPTAWEQYSVELINRARTNPTAEAARYSGFTDSQNNTFNGQLNEGLAAGTISTAAKQPLAINPYITDAARKHAQWMVDTDTFSHTGSGGSNAGQRIASAGYLGAQSWGENLAINWSSNGFTPTDVTSQQQRGLFTDMPISDRGHRTNMMDANRNEIGVGIATDDWNYAGYGILDSYAQSAETATDGSHFLTGVAYSDAVTNDDFYTPGEGLGGIVITATRLSDNAVFSASTWSSGGYSLELAAGTYNVKAAGAGLGATIYSNNVSVGAQNVKKDFVVGQTSDPVPEADLFAKVTDRTLVVTGTVVADVIGVSSNGIRYVATLNGTPLAYNITLVDVVAVLAGGGNDTIVIGNGIPKTYLEGGDGKDHITGGDGADSIYSGTGNDLVEGNAGADLIVTAGGNDLVYGGAGNDRIYTGAGNDTVDAGAGNDRVYGGDGNDLLAGATGRDVLYGELGADTLNGGRHGDYSDTDPADTRISIEVLA